MVPVAESQVVLHLLREGGTEDVRGTEDAVELSAAGAAPRHRQVLQLVDERDVLQRRKRQTRTTDGRTDGRIEDVTYSRR